MVDGESEGSWCIDWKVVVAIGMACFFLGYMATVYESNKEATDEQLKAYEIGFFNTFLGNVNAFILNCTPSNVEAFVWVSLDNKPKGTILRCVATNNTIALRFLDG